MINAAVACFPDTKEVIGSNPISSTKNIGDYHSGSVFLLHRNSTSSILVLPTY